MAIRQTQVTRRKLLYLHRAKRLEDLRVPPGNRLEALKGDRKGQYSIRLNDQWRICFRWKDGDAWDVEIVDYHGGALWRRSTNFCNPFTRARSCSKTS
jgi:proteic killer suppression protein